MSGTIANIPDDRQSQALVVMRFLIGMYFFYEGYHKFVDPNFMAHFPSMMANWASGNAFFFYEDLLQHVLIPNAQAVACLVMFAEMFCGVLFVLGLLMRVAIPLQIFLNLNYLLAAQHVHPSVLIVNVMLIMVGVALFWGRAGRQAGLDYWVGPWLDEALNPKIYAALRWLVLGKTSTKSKAKTSSAKKSRTKKA